MYSAGRSSPDSALASDIFDKFCSAVTFKSILSLYRQLCDVLRLKPTYFPLFYPKLKSKLRSWKAQALWSKFDKRAAHRCYNRGKPCSNTRVLIIGGGPCGLRTAIEAQLLGAKVVVVEKRDRFSRNNVLHLWPFVIHDLRALGAKKFFGKFCAGSIDHISIRQLQCILLKVALLLGVEIHENVAFESLIPPSEDQSIKTGWKAKVSPADHPVSQYEFDVLIGADGKRNTLEGFKRKEFRGRLAIAITANFVNRKTEAEARVEEISGVAFIFNQKFFRELNCATGIDLENIVYYKDETHYFVMTAKKHSLLNKGVIIQDYPDTVKLLSPENVNKEALMEYAREAADFSTNYQLPHLDFAVNHYGQPDVAMFDFTSMFAAENASRVIERNGHKLLMCLVGDSLLEPFWPTGSGCARGWLSSFDACWAIHSWSAGRMTPLEVLAERESVYRLLAQTTPENLNKDYNAYTVEPHTRYPNLNTRAVLDFQVKTLYDTDNPAELARPVKAPVEEATRKRTKRPDSFIHPDTLLTWLKKQVALYDVTIIDMTVSFQNGLALCAIIHRYRPDLLDFQSLDPANVAGNNQLAFDILEELGVPPVTTGYEMAQSDVPDKLAMLSYLTQVHELFRGEIPCVKKPKGELESEEEILAASVTSTPTRKVASAASSSQQPRTRQSTTSKRRTLERAGNDSSRDSTLARTSKADASIRKARKRRSADRPQQTPTERSKTQQEIEVNRQERKQKAAAFLRRQFDRSMVMLRANDLTEGGFSRETETDMKEDRNLHDISMFLYRLESDFEDKKRRLEKMLSGFDRADRSLGKAGARSAEGSESLSNKVRDLEAKLRGNRPADKKPKEMIRAIGKLDKSDWQVSALEKKIEENQNPGGTSKDAHSSKVPKWSRDAFADKFDAINRRIHGLPADPNAEKFANLERGMKQLERKLKEGSVLETGRRGNNKVSAMAEQLAKKVPARPVPDNAATADRPKPVLNLPPTGGSEACHFCAKRVYLMERMSAEGRFFHRGCFRCEYCATTLRLGSYAFVRDDVLGGVFFCTPHVGMVYYLRNKVLNRRVSETQIDGPRPDSRPDNEAAIRTGDKATVESSKVEPMKSPLVQAAVAADEFRRDGTPERVEFENSLSHDGAAQDEHLSEIDEDEWTDRNFGNSVHTDSEDEVSSLDDSTEDDDEEAADDANFMELDHPLTADETRKLAENWKKRYSTEALSQDSAEPGDNDDVRIDVPAFPIPAERRSSEEGASSDTEMGSDGSDYDNDGSDYEEDEEEGEEEETDEEDETDEMDSATEIETDSEFDHDVDVRAVGHQDIPTIVVNESEHVKRSLDHLNGDDNGPVSAHPKAEYVEQCVSLEPARPLQRTVSSEDRKPLSINPTPAPYSGTGLLAYLRRSELLEKSPSAVDVLAGSSIDLKKKYLLDYGGSLAQKSASTTNLDSKLKSFVDTISEAQKKLNPAPQPSVPMQVFLQNTGNIFQSNQRSVPNLLPIGNDEIKEDDDAGVQDGSTPDEEPPTPTNVQPPLQPVDTVNNAALVETEVSAEESEDDDEGSSTDDQGAASDLDTDSSGVPLEAQNENVAVPVVAIAAVVEEEETARDVPVIDLGEAPGESHDFDEHPAIAKPQLAVQEDFDLSPCSEAVNGPVSACPGQLVRSRSRESVDSGKLGLTETELSDWADTSLAGDLDLDSEPVKLPSRPPPPELPKTKPPPVHTNGPQTPLDDIEFADDGDDVDEPKPEINEQIPLPDNTPQVKPQLPEVPKSPALSLINRPKAFPSPIPSRQAPVVAPVIAPTKEVQLEMQRRSLGKKCESSPNLLRKKEAISQERERQGDLVRDLVLSRIQRTSPEKLRERRSSYGSVSPSGSSRASRCESEPRSVASPPPLFAASQSCLRSVAEAPPENEPPPPPPPPRTPIKSVTATEFKTPNVLRPADRQESARKEARAKAQSMADRDLGLSPPDYIENLREKLRRKPSTDDDYQPEGAPRTASFSSVQPNVSRSLAASPTAPPAVVPVAKSSSAPQAARPPSPKSDVIGGMFLQQARNDQPSGVSSPPQSPLSSSSSKSASYLWAGLSPSDSQAALEVESPASTSTPTTGGAKPKKSKDRERRRSLIQTIAGLFGKKDEQPAKESPVIEEVKKAKDVKSSPTGFRLPKFSPRKDKSPRDKSTDDSLDGTRSRAASSPVSPASDSRDSAKQRSSSMLASPDAGNSKAEASGSPWSSAFSLSSTKRQSKQAKQAARQAELKRLRMAQSIQRQLEEIEVKQKELEEQGVRLEKSLRGEDGGASGRDEPALMQEWFQLVHERNALSRYEQELMVRARELELEDIHARLQQELKDRMSLEETKKSAADVDREGAILSEMLEIVEQRDSLRSMLEEDRQRYREEDKDLEAQMLAKGLRLATLRQRKESQV